MDKIEIDKLLPDPEQPRQEFEPLAMARLEESIRKQGVLVPLAVEKQNGQYLIIDGERRYRAAKKLGLKTLPIVVHQKTDNFGRMVARFHLQEQHTNWSAFDKARAINSIKTSTDLTEGDIANLLGLAQKTVSGYIALLSLSARTMELSVDKRIPFTHLRCIAHSVKTIDAPKLKQELEQALINKVSSGVIETAGDITKYGKAVRTEMQKVVTKMISDPEYTVKQALVDAGIFGDMQMRNLVNQASWLSGAMKKGIELGFNQHMNGEQQKRFEGLVDTINKFIEGAGYVEPK